MKLRLSRIHPARAAWLGLLGTATLLSVAALASLASRTVPQARLAELVADYRPSAADPSAPAHRPRADSAVQDRSATVEQVSKRSLFAPPAGPKKPPAPLAVMGDQAVFPQDEWVKVGGEFQGCKLLRIGPDWVELEVEGKPMRLSVFAPQEGQQGLAAAQPTAPGPPGPPGQRDDRGRRFGRGPFTPTPEMIERFRAMPPDQRERILQDMPPEVRAQFSQ